MVTNATHIGSLQQMGGCYRASEILTLPLHWCITPPQLTKCKGQTRVAMVLVVSSTHKARRHLHFNSELAVLKLFGALGMLPESTLAALQGSGFRGVSTFTLLPQTTPHVPHRHCSTLCAQVLDSAPSDACAMLSQHCLLVTGAVTRQQRPHPKQGDSVRTSGCKM